MKKILLLLLSSSLASYVVTGQIDSVLKKADWKPGEEKTLNGHVILRHEGINDISGILNVGYQTLEQLKANLEIKAEKEMWTADKKQQYLNGYEELSPGGIIRLYIERATIDAANTDMFTVIVRDSTDKTEVFREDLDSQVPNTPESGRIDYWWNFTVVPIPKKIMGRIYVYIIDKLGGDNNKFKFEIKI